jgi:hypothetical protein
MIRVVDVKHRFVRRVLKSASAAVLVTSLLSCGGGGGTNVVSDTASAPAPPASTSAAVPPTPPSTNTPAALAEFWDRYGAKENFPSKYVELITKLLEAEDKVVDKDYQGARLIVDDLIKKNPLIGDTGDGEQGWWAHYGPTQPGKPRPHLGEPGPYPHLRMLDEITRVGISKPMLGKTPIQMTIVMPVCSDIIPDGGSTLINERLNPEIEAVNYKTVRQSLRLFQSYLLAISGGELNLELKFYKINKCFEINKEKNYVSNFNEPLLQLPKGVAEKTDMFWLIYPRDIAKGTMVGSFSGGISSFNGTSKPVFICEDSWIIMKRAPDQGVGPRTELERRMYLSQWLQHEFFHHLYSAWKVELGIEDNGHPWRDRNTWPADFTGKEEVDYYSETIRKRFYQVTPSIAQRLQRADK